MGLSGRQTCLLIGLDDSARDLGVDYQQWIIDGGLDYRCLITSVARITTSSVSCVRCQTRRGVYLFHADWTTATYFHYHGNMYFVKATFH